MAGVFEYVVLLDSEPTETDMKPAPGFKLANEVDTLPETHEGKGSRTPAFKDFHLPCGEPLCGWDWVHEHLYDLIDWVPRIEIITPDLQLAVDINSKKKLGDVVKAIRGLKR
jgi:hypothetical protein